MTKNIRKKPENNYLVIQLQVKTETYPENWLFHLLFIKKKKD